MNDMLNNQIKEGSVVIWPDGSARYGGLLLMVGVVQKLTPKRISILSDKLISTKRNIKSTTKTGTKILVVTDKIILESDTVKAILKEIENES